MVMLSCVQISSSAHGVCGLCFWRSCQNQASNDEGTYLLEELTQWKWLAVAKGSFEAKKRRKEETSVLVPTKVEV